MTRKRYLLAATSAIALTVILAACSTDPASDSMGGMDHGASRSATADASITNKGPHNAADVTFASSMIPHHQQAVVMADMILAKDSIDAEILDLATRIRNAQAPEITTMTSWLSIWGETVHGEGMEGMSDDGMMSHQEMSALDDATGDEAARLFLEGMTIHHDGAVAMATTETRDGQNPDAIALAARIIESQTAEITEMKALLSSL